MIFGFSKPEISLPILNDLCHLNSDELINIVES